MRLSAVWPHSILARNANLSDLVQASFPVEDLEQAQAIARQKGIGYQAVLKEAIRKGLRRTG